MKEIKGPQDIWWASSSSRCPWYSHMYQSEIATIASKDITIDA
jgi:hypothetical protein